ncbi:MAG: hypothetical protein PHS95_01880 [Candidatus Pacebacteria bacterium]|nr:hypothetical protein [Candidatus Paceibacterota bacterium]
MKDFFTWSVGVRNLLIVIVIMVFVYFSAHGVPVPIDEVGSSSLFTDLFSFLFGKARGLTFLESFFSGLRVLLSVVSVAFFAGTTWIVLRLREVAEAESKRYAPILPEVAEEKGKSAQWQSIFEKASGTNPAEWKLAILEADSVLDELLEERGCPGDSVGERLKSINPSDLLSYDDAWEAHKVRNQIAHEGASAELSQRIARDTIARYEKVFKEMGSI